MEDEEHERETSIDWGHLTSFNVLDQLEQAYPLRYRELVIEANGPEARSGYVWICNEGHVHLGYGPDTKAFEIVFNAIIAYCIARVLDTKKDIPKRPGKRVIERVIVETQSKLAEIAPVLADIFNQSCENIRKWISRHSADKSEPKRPSARAQRPPPARVPVNQVSPTAATQPPPRPLQATDEEFDKALSRSLVMRTFAGSMVVGVFTGQPIEPGQA